MANTVELLDRQTSQVLNDSMSTYYTTKQNIVFVAQELVENLAYLANTDVQTRKTNIIRNSLFRNRTKINTNVVPPTEAPAPAETPKAVEIKSNTDDLMRLFEEPPAAAASVAPPEASHPPIVPPAPVMEAAPVSQQEPAFFSMPPVMEQPISAPAVPEASTEELLSMFNEPAATPPAPPSVAPEPVYSAPVAEAPVYTPPAVQSQPEAIPTLPHSQDSLSELDSFFNEPSEPVVPQQPIAAQPVYEQPPVSQPVYQQPAPEPFSMPPVMEQPPVQQPSYTAPQPAEVIIEQPVQTHFAQQPQQQPDEEAIGQTLLNLDDLKNRISTTDSNVYISPTIKSHFSSILMEIESSLSNMKSYSTNKEMLISLYERLKSNQNMSMQEMVELSRHIVEANQFVEEYQAKAKDELDSMENVAELFKNMADALVYNIRKAKNDFNRGN